jgi:uncharacterized protein
MTIIWAVSDGRAGIERQAQALAQAIANRLNTNDNSVTKTAIVKTIRLTPHSPFVILPPKFWLNPLSMLPNLQKELFTANNMPDIWVANGRRAIAYSLYVKKHFPKTLVIHLQNPKIDAKYFDFIVAPKHDEVSGTNVFETLGGLSWYSNEYIANEQAKFPQFANSEKEKIMVILGGNSKTHKFTNIRARQILENLKELQSPNREFWITVSRRTPRAIAQKFRDFAQMNQHAFFESEAYFEPNPYIAWLSLADYALITEDSANMLSDCAFFGLPIHILKLEGHSNKFNRLHQSLIDAKTARWFEGKLEKFASQKINSVDFIAKSIIELWQMH